MWAFKEFWGCSSVGRAPALQAGGRQFESDQLHQNKCIEIQVRQRGWIIYGKGSSS